MDDHFTVSKSLCTPSKLPASDYVINPYTGCLHGCKYCYACFMNRFTGHTEKWGTYVDAKQYASYKLPKNIEGKTILIGSVTDAYNPAERHYQLMPRILESLASCSAHIEILTKSSLVLRDIDILCRIPDLAVGISLSNLCEEDNRITEPGASSAEERIKTLRVLHEAGIRTYLFIAPYLPGITDLQTIVQKASAFTDYLCVENLNLRGSYKEPMMSFVKERYPALFPLWQRIYEKKNGTDYWAWVEKEMEALSKELGKPVISYMYHEKIKKD